MPPDSSSFIKPRGRYAPSPTGLLHVGNARTALVAWLSVRSRGGTFIWRIEDLDPPRVLAGAAEAAMEDARWLGLDWDEGPEMGGPVGPYVQSERYAHYEAALQHLHDMKRLFPCRLSRKELRTMASAPHGTGGAPYPITLRPERVDATWFADLGQAKTPWATIRFKVDDDPVVFVDPVYGRQEEDVQATVGDFVLKRRDGLYAYQLAVVVDDWLMGIDEVVRGEDLLASTARQVQLMDALGGSVPRFAHVPLVLNADGEKLSKRDEALTLRALRGTGVMPEQLVGQMAFSLGLIDVPRPVTPADLIPLFAWERIHKTPFVLPASFVEDLTQIT